MNEPPPNGETSRDPREWTIQAAQNHHLRLLLLPSTDAAITTNQHLIPSASYYGP